MVSLPYALSVTHFINTVGADAGFAAIIGLALLVLLFFAQMRETSHLRDQVADATDQVSHLEYQLTQLTRGGGGAPASAPAPGVAPRPGSVPATAAGPVAAAAAASRAVAPAPSRAPVAAPIAPAGVGAPALASATRLIPAFDDGPISVRHTGAAALTGAAGSATRAVASASGPGGAVADPPGPPPATPAGGANGSTTGRATPPPAGAAPPRTGQATRPPAPRNGGRTAAPASRRTESGPEPRSRLQGLLGALIALGVVAVIVVVLLLLTGGSSSPIASSSSTSKASNAPATRRRGHRTAAIKPSSVTVAVLNGTSTNNLAHDVSVKLTAATYKLGKIATATDQTHTSTVVAYLPGHRAAALIVAKSLGLGAGVVSSADQSSQAVACPQGAPCSAQVIVTVGSDLNSVASSSTAPAAAPGTGTGPAAATSTG